MLPNNIQSMKQHIELAAYDEDLLFMVQLRIFVAGLREKGRREYPGIKEALWCLQVEVSLSEESPFYALSLTMIQLRE